MSLAASLADLLPSAALSGDGAAGPWSVAGREPVAVLSPESVEEVVAVVRWAGQHGVGVAPAGSGSRLRLGGAAEPFLVLRTDRMSGIEVYEPADLTFTAKAGTPISELDTRLREHRQWLPFDPPAAPERSLGGLVAAGESGPLATGYGALRNHVLGMTVVCGDGRVLSLGGRVVKNVAGFDLLKPVVGSRGGLAVVTSVCVRAFPVPAMDRLLLVRGDSAAALAEVASKVGTAPVVPASVVLAAPAPWLGAPAALVVRLHGARATVDADQAALERHCAATFERQREDGGALLGALRDHASDGAATLSMSLLPNRLSEGLEAMRRILGDAPLAADPYAGTARLGLPSPPDPSTAQAARQAVESLGGAVSFHAGGGDRSDLAREGSVPSPAEADLTLRLGRVFDPRGVLWPCRP